MVFDVRSGKILREFKGSADDFATGGTGGIAGVSWPVFRWAGGRDDKYFARIGKNAISVYETDTMGLFVPEGGGGNQPARVGVLTSIFFFVSDGNRIAYGSCFGAYRPRLF
jgi:translation initiation factor 3 subunit B